MLQHFGAAAQRVQTGVNVIHQRDVADGNGTVVQRSTDAFAGHRFKGGDRRHADVSVASGGKNRRGEGASKNLAAEIPRWDFDGVVRQAEQPWTRALGTLDAELPTQALSETFYTGAYHGLVAPATFNDVDGTYRGQDRQNHPNPGFTRYTALSIWDIYRGEFPFLTLMQPHRTNDIIRTLLVDYEQLDLRSLPMWTLWGNET